MTDEEKVALVQTYVYNDEEATESLVKVYLSRAVDAIVRWKYPCGVPEGVTPYSSEDDNVCCQLAARYFLRRGAEMENVHVENGVHRHYATTNDSDLLSEIIPYARLVK